MKIEKELLDDHQVRLTVEVDAEALEGAKRRAARKIANRVKIPGFRPGKAPYPVILRQVGEAAILEDALDFLVDDIYPKVIEDAEIRPYGPGSLEEFTSIDPPVIKFIVPLEAEVELGEYQSIRKPYEPSEVTETDVEEMLSRLQERQAVVEPVDRAIQSGDVVTVRLEAVRTEIEEGQEPVLIKERSFPVFITQESDGESEESESSSQNNEWPFPGFSAQLIGMVENDEKTLSYEYPADYMTESFQGIKAEFHAVVENVKTRVLPELNDEFAASVGEYSDLEALRADIRNMLESQAKEAYDEEYDAEILDQAIALSSFKYPPQMLENELDDMIEGFKNRLAQQNMDMDIYLKTRDMDLETFRKDSLPHAESRLKRSLLLLELAKIEDIHVDKDELETQATSTVRMLSNSLSKKEARKLTDRRVYGNIVGNIMMDMLSKQAMQRLRDISSGKADAAEDQVEESPADEEISAEPSEPESQTAVEAVVEAETEQLNEGEASPENE